MKKLCFIAISAVLCLGLTLPAMAAVTVSGLLSLDVYYYSLAEEPDGAGNDMKTTQFAIYAPLNYMRARYINDAQTFGGQFTIYTGRYTDNIADSGRSDYAGQVLGYDVGGGANYIWWKPMPALELKIGVIPQLAGGNVGPPTHLRGHDIIVLITYGNLHTSGRQGISGHYKVNDMVTVELGLYDPDNDTTPAIPLLGAGEETLIPRFDFSVPINFKAGGTSIMVQPKGSYHTKSYKDVVAGDDSFTIYTIGFDTQVRFGPVTGMFELDVAQNLAGGDSYVSGLLNPSWDGVSKITDSEALLGWAGLAYAINPKNDINIFYGSQEEEVGTLKLTGRSSYGIRHTYRIAPNFLLFPHLQWFKWHDTEVGGTTIATGQTATQLGVNFYLVF
jgi:hypothetical protein